MKTYNTTTLTLLMCLSALTLGSLNAADYNSCCGDGCTSGFIVGVEWLYLRPCNDELLFGKKQEEVANGGARTREKFLDPDLTSGFRLGIGYRQSNCCNWDVALNWLNYSVDESKKFKELNVDPNGFDGSGKVKWDLDLNLVDLELGYKFCVGECFALRPHVGFRFLDLDREIKVTILESQDPIPCLSDDENNSPFKKDTRDFDGVGPRFGLDATWDFSCGLGVYGDVGLSLVYGDVDRKKVVATGGEIDANLPRGANANGLEVSTTKGSFHCSTAVVDLGIGLFYQSCYCGSDYTINLGWEHHHFLDVGILLAETLATDVAIQGLRLGFNVGF